MALTPRVTHLITRALSGLRQSRPILSFRGAATVAAVLVAATSVGVLGAGGTYAYLNAATVARSTAALSAGTASLAISATSINLSNIYPGQTRTGVYTVTNTGDVPLNLTISSITGATVANGLTATLGASCTGTQYGSGSFGAAILAVGASTTVCLVVTMPLNAPSSAQGASSSITVQLSGVQA